MKKNYLIGVLLIISLITGFFIGRCTTEKEVVRYIKGATVRDTVKIPYPVFTEIPSTPQLPIKNDTIYLDSLIFIVEKVDTAEIIKDYITQKTYEFNVFDSGTLGKFDVKQQIGYNKLLSFDYTFTPITRIKEPLFTPFITGGYSTNKSLIMGGGIYYRNIGFEYNYNITLDKTYYNDIDISQSNYHTLKLNYKF